MRSNQAELQALLEITAQKHKPSKKYHPRICPITNEMQEKRERVEESLFRPRHPAAQVLSGILRKEVIQPQVLLRLPCYDFTPVVNQSLGACLPKVSSATSALVGSHGVTGGVYKARERIHRGVLIRDY